MIVCDTREKKNEHILRYLEFWNIPYRVAKLDTGDYLDDTRPDVVIDRKQNLAELCGNLFSDDKGRFWREVRRAKTDRIRLIFLIEQGGKFKTLQDVPQWKSRFTKITGYQLYNEMCRCHIAYGVEFWFCDKRSTGKRIVEILAKGGKK